MNNYTEQRREEEIANLKIIKEHALRLQESLRDDGGKTSQEIQRTRRTIDLIYKVLERDAKYHQFTDLIK